MPRKIISLFSAAFFMPILIPIIAYAQVDLTQRERVMEVTLCASELKMQSSQPSARSFEVKQAQQERLSEDIKKYWLAKEKLNAESSDAFNEKQEYLGEEEKGKFYISGGYDATHMHYTEFSGSTAIDEDYGNLRGFYGSLGYKSGRYLSWLWSRPFVEGYFRRYDALITYDGGTSAGDAFSCEQKAEVQRFGLKFGGYHSFSEKLEGLFYIDIGKRIWYRGENEVIDGVLCYAEKYWWVYMGLGGGLNYRLFSKLTCGAELEGMFALHSEMRADLYEGGTFVLGGVSGWEVKLPIKYYFLHNLSLDLTPYFTWWNITKSDPVRISGAYYYEPDSYTYIQGLLLGLTCSF